MAQIQCFICNHKWDLGSATTNRCPNCGAIQEIYYDRDKAEAVARIYNEQSPPLPQPSGVNPLIDMDAYSVSFPDQGRLAEVAEKLIDI